MSIPQQGGGLIESRDDLIGFFSSGCKPPEDWRIGIKASLDAFSDTPFLSPALDLADLVEHEQWVQALGLEMTVPRGAFLLAMHRAPPVRPHHL